MKRLIIIAAVASVMASCAVTKTRTARTADISSEITQMPTVVELDVADKREKSDVFEWANRMFSFKRRIGVKEKTPGGCRTDSRTHGCRRSDRAESVGRPQNQAVRHGLYPVGERLSREIQGVPHGDRRGHRDSQCAAQARRAPHDKDCRLHASADGASVAADPQYRRDSRRGNQEAALGAQERLHGNGRCGIYSRLQVRCGGRSAHLHHARCVDCSPVFPRSGTGLSGDSRFAGRTVELLLGRSLRILLLLARRRHRPHAERIFQFPRVCPQTARFTVSGCESRFQLLHPKPRRQFGNRAVLGCRHRFERRTVQRFGRLRPIREHRRFQNQSRCNILIPRSVSARPTVPEYAASGETPIFRAAYTLNFCEGPARYASCGLFCTITPLFCIRTDCRNKKILRHFSRRIRERLFVRSGYETIVKLHR